MFPNLFKRTFAFYLLLLPLALIGQEPFVCTGNFYLALGQGQALSTVYEVEIEPNSGNVIFDPLTTGTSGGDINAMGYRFTDNFIYGINPGSFALYRIGSNGAAQTLGTLALNPLLFYIAGDVTPDGKYLVIIGASNNRDETLVFVDLESPTFETSVVNITGTNVRCADVAFDPTDGQLYGFDASGKRLVIFNTDSGQVSSGFPATSTAEMMGGLFFDPFGNLFGYGQGPSDTFQQSFFSVDKTTGEVTTEATGPTATRNDGCSCPFTIGLKEWVNPINVVPCTEVPYTIEIANTSGLPQSDLTLEQTFPASFLITNIDNPLGGIISEGGIGTNTFTIDDLTIPLGVHKIVITVELLPNSSGTHEVQATLSGLPEILGEVAISDNPFTVIQDDPTVLIVSDLEVDFSQVSTIICEGDVITLDPSIHGVSYLWSDGSTDTTFTITQGGNYAVTISSGCDIAIETLDVDEIELQLDLGPELTVELGDSIRLHPDVFPSANGLQYTWSTNSESGVCLDCENPFVRPFFDAMYYLTVTNGAGCLAIDSVLVRVEKNRRIFIPNAFSPNSDGINDVFFIQSSNAEEVVELKILDRWGNLIFEDGTFFTNDRSKGWTGRYQGKMMNSGVFVYLASIRFLDGVVIQYSGDITIVN